MIYIEKILNEAKQETGISHFYDSSVLKGLEQLVKSINNNVKRHDERYEIVEQYIKTNVKVNLSINYLARECGYTDTRIIEKPIFIAGTGRTATTYLQKLLSLDEDNRVLRYKNLLKFRSFSINNKHTSSRRANEDLDRPTQCAEFLESNMSIFWGLNLLNIPDYANWCFNADQNNSYQIHKKALRLLQGDSKKVQWILKSSVHAMFLDAIMETYPDARIIQLHRDPLAVYYSRKNYIKSNIKASPIVPERNPDELALQVTYESISRILKFRDFYQNSIFDGYYRDFISDSLNTVKQFYRKFDINMSAETENKMKVFISDYNRKHKNIVHIKDKSDLPKKYAEIFHEYKRKFNIPDERIGNA